MTDIIKFIAIFSLFTLLGCKNAPAPEAPKSEAAAIPPTDIRLTEAQWANANISVEPVSTAFINHTIKLSGTIDVPPQNMISISCPMGGYLKNIHLLPGEEVRKGQEIAVLEDPAYIQLQQDYLVGKAKLVFQEQEYARQKELAATEAASQKTLQQVTADLYSLNVGQKALEQKLALIGIQATKLTPANISRSIALRSPIHGFVTKVNVNIGRYVSPTEVLVELVDPSDIHATLTVFEKDINLIEKEQKVGVTLLDKPGKIYQADVLLVTRNVDEKRAGLIHCHFDTYAPELLPGMFINGDVELGALQMPAVPEEAILLYQGRHYVFVEMADKQFRLTEVQPGEKEGGKIGLANNNINWIGKKVAVKNVFTLLGMIMNTGEE